MKTVAITLALMLFPLVALARGGGGHGGGGRGGGCVGGGGGRGGGHGGAYGGGFHRPWMAPSIIDHSQFQLWHPPPPSGVMYGNPDPPFVPYFTRLPESAPVVTPPSPPTPRGPEVIIIHFVDDVPRRPRHHRISARP